MKLYSIFFNAENFLLKNVSVILLIKVPRYKYTIKENVGIKYINIGDFINLEFIKINKLINEIKNM